MMKMNYYLCWFFFFFFLYFSFNGLCFSMMDYVLVFEYNLVSFNSVDFLYIVYLDKICFFFISVVLFISSMVILYSLDYMGLSLSSVRFFFLILLFIFSMFLMIMSPNLLSILLGWDGLGLISYCLVIYYSSLSSYFAGLITCLINRLGDIGLLIFISWSFSYGSWHFFLYNSYYSSFFVYILVFSSFTSSAQVPFSSWLPAAMAAPTPVSALVHSSTLVTAGVYLLIRFFMGLNSFFFFFFFFGLFTMFFSSFCAIFEFDLSSIIALSTLSQLGLMISCLFSGYVDLSFFHLISHAMFKSLLFLCAGIFIYYMGDNQDIRYMGSVCKFLPFTTSCFNISSFALCGVPFLSGFYSSDFIVEVYIFNMFNMFSFFVYYFCLGMTVVYSFRLFYYSMIFDCKFISFSFFYEDLNLMSISIYMLVFFSLFTGCMFMWLMDYDLDFVFLPLYVKLMSFFSFFFGLWFGFELFKFSFYFFFISFYYFNGYMWFINSYSFYFYKCFYYLINSGFSFMSWGEYYGGYGFSYYFYKLVDFLYIVFTNSFNIFLLSFFIWFFIMI
uniref:NADH dehydrogenase subunit 5 n=1 Tax=Xestocephalus limpidissimus TaxID=3112140 RepID=UPI002E76C446|nr:NADH dehydrogenase subunit 5 [Xestocephalus limpidissimus]WRK21330.1 NADH dehydrogenase subunit 5 [Xestocephalus limpidissimus]